MKFGVVVFPGSNCDYDAFQAVRDIVKAEVEYIWHTTASVAGFDCVILPGGFSYGDYLRTGAIAHVAPVMTAVKTHAENGGKVIGICNGFQILLESGLLPGAMLRNHHLQFACQWVHLRVITTSSGFTKACRVGEVLKIPIAHGEGNYFADQSTIDQLKENNQIVLRYCDMKGNASDVANPNGSMENIAGICNKEGNVFGLMPHPERAVEKMLGSADGLKIFQSILR